MNTREHYTLAYRTFRQTKGSVSLRGDKPIVSAWKSYDENFKFSPDQALYGYDALTQQLWKHRQRYSIHLAYHFNTNFKLSKAYKWSAK